MWQEIPDVFHTSHPQLCAAFRRSDKWIQTSAKLYADDGVGMAGHRNKMKGKSNWGKGGKSKGPVGKYGGHFRAVQGFKYIGDRQ